MPLFVDKTVVTEDISSVPNFLEQHPLLIKRSKELRDGEVKVIGSGGLLYVLQREMGMTDQNDDKINFLGSEDATTCHIVILTLTDIDGKIYVCLSHLDGCGTRKAVKDMLLAVTSEIAASKRAKIELHIAGGFDDDRLMSEELSVDILNTFRDQSETVDLVTCCVSGMNNILKNEINYPVIYGLVVDVKSGMVSKASFTDKGPCIPLRSARHFTGSHDVLNIYNKTKNMLIIGPFLYKPLPNIDTWLALPNDVMLQHLSTSPAQEPANFVEGVKSALKQMKDHPKPLKTVFKDAQPLTFQKEINGNWSQCSPN